MLKQQEARRSKKYNQIPLWKRMTLITALLLSAGSLVVLAPGQAASAHGSKPNTSHHARPKGHSTHTESIKLLIICQAGNGGQGGSATKKSSGATGGSGGNCIITIPIKVSLVIQHNKHHT